VLLNSARALTLPLGHLQNPISVSNFKFPDHFVIKTLHHGYASKIKLLNFLVHNCHGLVEIVLAPYSWIERTLELDVHGCGLACELLVFFDELEEFGYFWDSMVSIVILEKIAVQLRMLISYLLERQLEDEGACFLKRGCSMCVVDFSIVSSVDNCKSIISCEPHLG
jgi:hypothetical protein